MEKKNIVLFVVLVIAVVAIGAYVVNQSMGPQKGTTVTSSYDPKTQGKVVLGITDAAADLNGVSSVFITVKNRVSEEAKLPSGELKIIASIVVSADKTSTMVFDFIADKSLHMTGSGKIIFAPVVKIQKTNNVSVELTSKNEIKIMGGNKE